MREEIIKKPEHLGQGGKGAEVHEVSGRCRLDDSDRIRRWTCWRCGTVNFGSIHPKAYVCWKCGAMH